MSVDLSPSTLCFKGAYHYCEAIFLDPNEEKLQGLLSDDMNGAITRCGVTKLLKNKVEYLDFYKSQFFPYLTKMEFISQSIFAQSEFTVFVNQYSVQNFDIDGKTVQSKVTDNIELRFRLENGQLKIIYAHHNYDPRTGISNEEFYRIGKDGVSSVKAE